MYFTQGLLVGATCLLAFACQAQALIAFTKQPATVKAGEPTTLEWSGGDGSAVTITLKKGDPSDLKTVNIITGDASGNSYTWTPPADLPSGDDYAFQINQGVSDVNYSGQFSFSGGSGVVSSVSEKASSATSVSASSAVSASKTSASAASITSAASASLSSLVSSLLSAVKTSSSSSSGRLVVTTVVSSNVTTATVGTGVLGTGLSSISRNTTLSSATLTKTATLTTSVATTVTSKTSAAGTSGTKTGASTSASSPAPNNGSATSMASPLAFVISAFVAIMYLG